MLLFCIVYCKRYVYTGTGSMSLVGWLSQRKVRSYHIPYDHTILGKDRCKKEDSDVIYLIIRLSLAFRVSREMK